MVQTVDGECIIDSVRRADRRGCLEFQLIKAGKEW